MASFSSSNAMLSSFSSTVPAMAEPQAVASMAGDEEHMNTDLQDTIHFEKTLTPSNVPNGVPNSRCSLEIPQWFVEKHGDKFEEYVILRCGTSAQPRAPWVVRISLSALPLVRMSCGWKKFAAFNGLREGNSLVFCLRAMSEFEVFVFPGPGSQLPPSVDALCEPMGKLFTLGNQKGTVAAATTNTPLCISSHSKFHPGFPMENVRVSSLRNSLSPPVEHPERTVSFSGFDTVYVATPRVVPSNSSHADKDDHSHIRNLLGLKF